jgi:hypothetical protein
MIHSHTRTALASNVEVVGCKLGVGLEELNKESIGIGGLRLVSVVAPSNSAVAEANCLKQ